MYFLFFESLAEEWLSVLLRHGPCQFVFGLLTTSTVTLAGQAVQSCSLTTTPPYGPSAFSDLNSRPCKLLVSSHNLPSQATDSASPSCDPQSF